MDSFFTYSLYFYALRNNIMSKNSFPVVCRPVQDGSSENCGVSRARTGDPLLAKQVLYQLSYNPA